jgi:hypothetical protein
MRVTGAGAGEGGAADGVPAQAAASASKEAASPWRNTGAMIAAMFR